MRTNRAGSDALATPRAFAMAMVLFVVGLGFGLLGALVSPIAAARAERDARPAAAPAAREAAVPAQDAAPDDVVEDCTPGSLRRRAAQVLVVGIPDVTLASDPLIDEVAGLGVGGVFLNDGNVVDTAQVQTLTATLRQKSKLPLLITTDEESGRVSSFRALIGTTSSPRTLAATRTTAEVREYAADMGSDLAALGLNSDLAPVADVDAGSSYGLIGDRAFSGDPLVAAEYAEAFAAGLADAGLLPVAKHFPGHGRATDDVHKRRTIISTSLEDLLKTDVLPFIGLIERGTPIVMVGHPTYTALDGAWPASLSPATYRLLRDLEFSGVAITDSIGMGAINRRWKFPEASVLALRAGADAVLATDGRQATAMVDGIVAAVKSGDLPERRLDEAAARMLAIKGVEPGTLSCTDPGTVPSMAHDAVVAKR